jgi:hypothetical protein
LSNDSNSRLEWALKLAEQGFRIFPLQPGSKTPFKGSWKDMATTDPDMIRTWFENNSSINYAVNPDDKHVVIDIDRKPDEIDGLDNFVSLAVESDDWDWADFDSWETFTVQTPSGKGGYHVYLRTDEAVGNSHQLWPESIDIRGVGGYVVGPGSYLDAGEGKSGEYSVVKDAEPAPAPKWAKDRFRRGGERTAAADEALFDQDTPAAIERARDFLSRRKVAVEGQKGEEHTLVTAMHLRDIGLSAEKCVEVMCEKGGWNERCEPPWEIGELSVKVENAYKYAKNQPGQKQVEADSFGDMEGVQDISEIAEKFEQERGAPAETAEGLASLFFRGASLQHRGHRREMIVPEWLMAHGLTAVNAKRGQGKSIMMIDLACQIALKEDGDDRTWMGQPIADGWKVIYICGEDDVGLEENLRAWMKYHDKELPEDRFAVMAGTVDLMSADSVKAWTQFLYDNFSQERTVIFVDTWQRASSRGGQNKDEDMQMAVHHVEAMAKSLGGPVVAAFHPPKDGSKTLLGSSVLENSTTGIWDIEDSNGARKLSVSRIKGKGIGNYVLFDVHEVDLDEQDDFGKQRSGAIAKRLGGTEELAVKSENLRKTVAKIISEIEEWRKANDPTTKRKLTPNEIDRFIGQGGKLGEMISEMDSDGYATPDAKWAKSVFDRLRDVNFVHGKYRNRIPELFSDHPMDMGDGYVLRLIKQNEKMSYFEFERGTLFSDDEDEDDSDKIDT